MQLNQKGFTLIELVIVLAVIGILSTFMVPKFTAIQDRAKEQSLKTVARTIQIALETYYLSEGTYIKGDEITIEQVIKQLKDKQLIQDQLVNPFTSAAFTSTDTSGKITYSYSNDTGVYEGDVFGKENKEVIFNFSNQ